MLGTMTSHCCEHHAASSVCQTLDEMEFERGLWSAALNGEMDRVKKLIADGRDPNGLDSSGYTALVSSGTMLDKACKRTVFAAHTRYSPQL